MILQREHFFHNLKGNLAFPCLIYGAVLHCVFCSCNPRLTRRQDDAPLVYSRNYSHTILHHQEGSKSLFVGASNFVLHIDVDSHNVLQNFTLNPNLPRCSESSCQNEVTVIEKLEECTLACGTNAEKPACWKLFPEESNRSAEVIEGKGISPFTCTQNSLTLVADGNLYAAAPLYMDGTQLQFRRKAGKRNSVWMDSHWLSEPTFISSFLAKRNNDSINEKIYVLFREKNSDTNPEADPWISRVARVCEVDDGGPKYFLQNIWTTFLKARLVCGFPRESLYFNRLQDVFVLHAEDWRESLIYALFSSSWNSTAVCIYSMATLDDVFEKSTLKGYSGTIPNPRPGACVKGSTSVPLSTLSLIKDYSEMKDWIRPLQEEAPFFTSNKNFTKIAVDKVQALDGSVPKVLLLATDSGTIFKILEDGSSPFIISEIQLCNVLAPVQSMKLDSEKRKLFVGYPGQLSVLDLQRCHDYGNSCEECVLSRDPYCAWSENGCTSQTKGGIQILSDGNVTISCAPKSAKRVRRDFLQSSPLRIQHFVPTDVPFYLSCPVDSHYASYNWQHGHKSSPCQESKSECLHLIPSMSADMYGNYSCISQERDYIKTVREYQLLPKAVSSLAFTLRAHCCLLATFATSAFYLC